MGETISTLSTIPLTKLQPPQPAHAMLARPQLTEALFTAATSKRLTLLSAPAGSGKSSSVVVMHQAHPEQPLVWAALDEGDDDPTAFLQLLIAATRRVLPAFGKSVLPVLDNGGVGVAHMRLMGILINELTQIEPSLIIVLDDLHRVTDRTIHQMLDYLLERLPPRVHLVATTRSDPPLRLAQLRMRGELAEFRLAQLRFSAAETGDLFATQLDLSTDELEMIQQRTDGWAAGLRLVLLSLAQIDSKEQQTAQIRRLAASRRFLFDYLVDEVLNRLAERDRRFLLQTSILDELTATVCAAVSRRDDAAKLLEDLYRRNLFLFVSGYDVEPVYRYHQLFAQFLQKQLQQDPSLDWAQLHRRAAAAVPNVERRVHHLLAAEAWQDAAALLVEIGRQQCARRFVRPQLIDWIDRLPQTVREQHYWFDLIRTSFLEQQGRFSEAEHYARQAQGRAQEAGDVQGEAIAVFVLANWSPGPREPQWTQRWQALLQDHADALTAERRMESTLSTAWNAISQGKFDDAAEPIRTFYDTLCSNDSLTLLYMASQHIGPQWLFIENGMTLSEQTDRSIMRRLGEGDGLAQAGVYMRRAWRCLLRGDLTKADQLAQRALRIADQFGSFAFLDSMAAIAQAVVLLARSQFDQLNAFVEQREQAAQRSEVQRATLAFIWIVQWRAFWLEDNVTAAGKIRARIEGTISEQARTRGQAVATMAGWHAHAAGDDHQAEEMLREAVRRYRATPWSGTWGNPLVDLALFYLLQGHTQAAGDVWREAAVEMQRLDMPAQPLFCGRKVIPLLKLAQRQEIYADLAQVSLDAFGVPGAQLPLAIPGRDEVLTPREVEVLQLLMSGATNREIGEQLVITTRTAKAHVSNILAKFGVSSRTEAVARAHELSLL